MSTGTAAPAKPSPTVAKSVDKLPGDSAAAIAKEDPVKAIEKLEARARAVNVNNIARVSNSHLTSDDEKLTPLVSVKTGKAIDKFPSISREISKMTLAQINSMLNELDAERVGNEAARRERLRVQIGLKPNPA